ncbi:MAG TPA: penicillin-binding transpeptidase domain-containing protein [Actinomycetota bacterium]|jgi:peptidoglycan glycosyltransferase|nr:penicillin-binding transpeptidase domain-containing protein [Actinomycetota bacterium]
MTPQIRRTGVGLLIAFLLVFAQLNYVQIFAAERIASNPANIRGLLREYSIKRGNIITVDDKVIARSVATDDNLKYLRTYPEGELFGHVTGFYSIVFGTRALEDTYNDQLLGEGGVISMQDVEDQFLGSGERGDDVITTIDSRLQEIAREQLGDQRGAVIALDPGSGEVRAMWSYPSYDPGPFASHTPREERRYARSLNPRSQDSPLINGATQRGFPPGSTFKVVTAAAALESGRYGPSSTFADPVALELPQTVETLQNFSRTSCAGGGEIDLYTALVVSCDTTFGMLGLQIPDEIRSVASEMGFNGEIPFDVRVEQSRFPEVPDDQKPLRAFAGIGQADVVATPLQMALVAATVAEGGVVPRPRLVREVLDASGGIVESYSPETLGRALTEETAGELTRMMVDVVASPDGTGGNAAIPGIEVAAKTGTAQSAPGAAPHAWFIAFAPANDPQLAVAVLVENGGSFGAEATGGVVAAPIAKALLEADREIRGW